MGSRQIVCMGKHIVRFHVPFNTVEVTSEMIFSANHMAGTSETNITTNK